MEAQEHKSLCVFNPYVGVMIVLNLLVMYIFYDIFILIWIYESEIKLN